MYICICNAVTERDINHCVKNAGACSLEDLQRELGVAAGCGCCRDAAKDVLAAHRSDSRSHLAEAA